MHTVQDFELSFIIKVYKAHLCGRQGQGVSQVQSQPGPGPMAGLGARTWPAFESHWGDNMAWVPVPWLGL